MKKIFLKILLVISLLSILNMTKVKASEYSTTTNVNNEIFIINSKKIMADMYSRYPESYNLRQIQNVKTLNDMNGKAYNLIEFSPVGYAIYNNDYSMLLEISSEAISPYLDKEGDLIYLGAFNYYNYNDFTISNTNIKSIKHCISDCDIILNNDNMRELKYISNKLNTNIEEALLEIDSYLLSNRVSMLNDNILETASVVNPDIIKKANTSGFNSAGNCGYVAGALIVYYAAKSWGWNYLYNDDTISIDLVNDIQGNRSNTSWAPDLEDALNDYLNAKGATHNAKVNMWHIPAAHSFYDRVNEDKPVVLFGKLPGGGTDTSNKSNHAVVVYKVTRDVKTHLFGIKTYSNYMYTVHWGWGPTRNDVQISHGAISIGGLVNLHK